MKHIYKYYVVYFFGNGVQNGLGSFEYSVNKKVKTMNDILAMTQFISREYCSNGQVTVLNYTRIK